MKCRRLSGNQERYILAETASEACFFIPVYYRISGILNIQRINESILHVCSRHDSCKTYFERDQEGGMIPTIAELPNIDFQHIKECSTLAEFEKIAIQTLQIKPDFSSLRSLHRYRLFELNSEEYVLLFSQHHAISDGLSIEIFIHEVFTHYEGQPLPVAGSCYDYYENIEHENTEWKNSVNFWKHDLKEIGNVQDFNSDLLTQGIKGGRNFLTRPLGVELTSKLTELAKNTNLSTFNILVAVYSIQLSEQFSQDDIVFSIQSAGRYKHKTEQSIIGSFSNALILRVHLDLTWSVLNLAKQIKVKTKEILSNENIPYHIVQQLTQVSPKFAINMYPKAKNITGTGLEISERVFLNSESDYALNLRWTDQNGNLSGTLFYDIKRISADRIDSFWDRTHSLLKQVCQDSNVSCLSLQAKNLPYFPERMHTSVLPATRIHESFSKMARLYPNRDAIRYGGNTWSYSKLESTIFSLIEYMQFEGVGVGDRVALHVARNPFFIVGMLASSYLGASFVTLDSAYPKERLLEYCNIVKPDFLLFELEDVPQAWVSEAHLSIKQISYSRYKEKFSGKIKLAKLPSATFDEIAYFLFTSGTTGKPKCIGVTHAPLQHFILWQIKEFSLNEDDRFTMLSGLSHDPILRDVFTPLSIGATLSIPDHDVNQNPKDLIEFIRTEKPSVCHLTPPMGKLILAGVNNEKSSILSLRYMFWGGDMLGSSIISDFSKMLPVVSHVNFYGSTETPQAVTYFIAKEEIAWLSVPIGRGISGVNVNIVTSNGRKCRVNEIGEIRVYSPFQTYTINGDEELSPILKPVGNEYEYKTGDIGFSLPNGEIVLMGRVDDQIKIRGYRVDLEEINSKLCEINSVKYATSIPHVRGDGMCQIFSYVELMSLEKVDSSILKRSLQSTLPSYMVPQAITILKKIPLLPNGKVNRRELPIPSDINKLRSLNINSTARLPQTKLEIKIAAIFKKVTAYQVGDVSLSLSDIGADSLTTIEAQLRLESVLATLPENWVDLDIQTLATSGEEQKAKSVWKTFTQIGALEPHVIMRAAAIVSINAQHFHWFSVGGGMTLLLFLIAGYGFGTYQLGHILERDNPKSMLKTISTVFFASLFAVSFIYLGQTLLGQQAHNSTLLFYTNFLDFDSTAPNDGRINWLWFIASYLQIYLVIYFALRVTVVRRILKNDIYNVILGSFLIFTLLRFGIPGIYDWKLLTEGVPILTRWNYLPTTHLSTVFLGILIAFSHSRKKKLFVAVFCVLFTWAVSLVFSANNPVIFVVSALLIIFMKKVYFPKFIAPVIMAVSSASLFIYLFHAPLHKIFKLLHVYYDPAIYTILSIIVSVILWKLWLWVTRAFHTYSRSPSYRAKELS